MKMRLTKGNAGVGATSCAIFIAPTILCGSDGSYLYLVGDSNAYVLTSSSAPRKYSISCVRGLRIYISFSARLEKHEAYHNARSSEALVVLGILLDDPHRYTVFK